MTEHPLLTFYVFSAIVSFASIVTAIRRNYRVTESDVWLSLGVALFPGVNLIAAGWGTYMSKTRGHRY